MAIQLERMRRLSFVAVAGLLVVALSSCREEEQDRILRFEKGTYLGAADAKLSPDQVEALTQRTAGPQI
jgi:hypothetical protein